MSSKRHLQMETVERTHPKDNIELSSYNSGDRRDSRAYSEKKIKALKERSQEREIESVLGNGIMTDRQDPEYGASGINSEAIADTVNAVNLSERKRPWLNSLIVFCGTVSVVGLRYVVNTSTSVWRRFIWLLLILGGAGFTVYQLRDRIQHYANHPVSVITRVEYADEMRFPTVTICNENRVSLKKVAALGMTDLLKKFFPPFPTLGFVPNFKGYDLDQQNIDWYDMYAWIAPDNALTYCVYNAEICTFDRHVERTSTNMGLCITFNNGSMNYTSRQPGLSGGLTIGLFVNQSDYTYANSPAAGFRILLHGPKEVPMMIEQGFKVSPGFSTQIAISATYIKELPEPFGDCEPSEDYVQSRCLDDCVANYVINSCNCKEVHMPGVAPICDPRMFYECAMVASANYVRDNEAAKCNCPRQCHHLTYQTTISQARMSLSAARYMQESFGVNDPIEDIINNNCMVEIFFSEVKYTYIESKEGYSLLALLCDIGGALGLILGSTMLTLGEFADFFITLVLAWIKVRVSPAVNNEH